MPARRGAAILALVVAFSTLAQAYYQYVHFNTRTGPWVPAYEKFDLAALPNKTITYFIAEPGGAVQLSTNDSAAGLISQIRAGAKVWNDVAASDLRVAFGGIVPVGTQQFGTYIDVQYDEMPPGVLAYGGPVVLAEANGSFVPIQQSHVVLNKDMTAKPSFSEAFFGTLVHEFGHALGLQHTLTSAAMSTETTRATSKARPLAADDVAGLAVLYPAAGWLDTVGSISGRVAVNGQPVNLASVVAITAGGSAISAMSLPDGTYRIDGLPAGEYLVYAHALPPALSSKGQTTPANITLPVDQDGKQVAAGQTFGTLFYPGVLQSQQAIPVKVTALATAENINFDAQPAEAPRLHSIETYGFPAQVAVKPPFLSSAAARPFVVAGGPGLMVDGAPVSGLSVQLLGGLPVAAKAYSQSNAYAQLNVDTRASYTSLGAGPRHMIFTAPGELYVLPSAFIQTLNPPPAIVSVSAGDAGGTRAALLTGTNLDEHTRVLFDGVAGENRGLDSAGRLIVVPPPGNAGAHTAVVALNADGQSSLFLKSDAPIWTYEGEPQKQSLTAVVTPSALPAGAESVVSVEVPGANFVRGYASIAFSTGEIGVKRVWVVSATKLLASVVTGANGAGSLAGITITNGLQTIAQGAALQIVAARTKQPAISSRLISAVTGDEYVYAGATVLASFTAPLAAANAPLALTFNDVPIPVAQNGERSLLFQIPAGTLAGPAILRLQVGQETSLPVAVVVSMPPPYITGASVNGVAVDAAHPVRAGDSVTLTVAGLAEVDSVVSPGRVFVGFNDNAVTATQVVAGSGSHTVTCIVPAGNPPGTVLVFVTIEGRTSRPIALPYRLAGS